MKRLCILSLSLAVLPACSGDDSTPAANTEDASLMDTSTPEDTGVTPDAEPTADAGVTPDTGAAPDTGTAVPDAESDAADAGGEADASDGGCPTSWYVAPVTDPSIALPDGGGGVLLHAMGSGTQNYVCKATPNDSGGPEFTWTLVTPDANLTDCHANVIGHHFASEAGASFPEWQTTDGTYVIGTKHLPTFTPDGGAGSIPWLLLTAVDAGGSGTLSMTDYIQRLNTDGGNAPSTGCAEAGDVGSTTDVPYTADYYFYGP
jgi:hypothetical protein